MAYLNNFFSFALTIKDIIRSIDSFGGVPYFVGGCVRDLVIGQELKDFDIEVHGLPLDSLQFVLSKFGHVRLVGKKFGVLRIDGFDVDWSLPRKDSIGRKPIVEIDPTMTIQDACQRRDVRMNAMALDVRDVLRLSCDDADVYKKIISLIVDPWGGLDDIKNKQIRAVDSRLFVQDPLRFFRVMHFVGRFEMEPDDELNSICGSMELKDTELDKPLAHERICDEFKKLLLRSKEPARGFLWLHKINRLREILPELAKTIGVMQHPDHHPEGDVFTHTMQALDCAASYKDYHGGQIGDPMREKLLILLGTLCHDLGKVDTTTADLKAYGHAQAGVIHANNLLKKITNDYEIINMVCQLVEYHMLPFAFVRENAGARSYRRLAIKLKRPLSLRQLGLVAFFDSKGRAAKNFDPSKQAQNDFEVFLSNAKAASVVDGPEEPILQGRHLLEILPPGPLLGKALKKAYLIQMEEGIKDIEELKKRVIKDL